MCDICQNKRQPLFRTSIHFMHFQPIVLSLCYTHDIELFKTGQSRFLHFYKDQLASKLSSKVSTDGDIDGLDFA
jgi:hypothetical protein